MFAFKAAKRTPLLMLFLVLLVAAPLVAAGSGQGYLGVTLQDITDSMAKALQLDENRGALVNGVGDDTPAAKAGVEVGDVILGIDGKLAEDWSELGKLVRKGTPGEKAELLVLRNGKEKKLDVVLAEREDDVLFFDKSLPHLPKLSKHMKKMQWFGDGDHKVMVMPHGDHKQIWIGEDGDIASAFMNEERGFMGVHLDDFNDQMGEFFGVEDGKGALVTTVTEDSPAAEAGLKAGDVIVKVGDEEIDSPSDVHEAMSETEPGQEIKVAVVRKGDNKSFDVTLGEYPEDALANHFQIYTGDDHFSIRAPHKFIQRFHDDDGNVEVEVFEDDLPQVKLRRMLKEDDLEKVREELDELRQELKKMQEELNK